MDTRNIIARRDTLTKDEIKKIAAENKIEFIKLEFCDINGIMKNLSIPIEQLESAMNNEIMLDGSSIKGFRSIETSDIFVLELMPPFRNPRMLLPTCEECQ